MGKVLNDVDMSATAKKLKESFKLMGGWGVDVDSLGKMDLVFPGGEQLSFDVHSVPWHRQDNQLKATGNLYLHSMQYLVPLIDKGEHKAADLILRSYEEFIESDEAQRRRRSDSSWDHCVSMRIHVYALLAVSNEKFKWLLTSKTFETDCNWALVSDNIQNNNHGMLLISTLLNVRDFLRFHDASFERRIDEVVKYRLPEITNFILGDDGYAAENSPMYSAVWLNLLQKLVGNHSKALSACGLERDLAADIDRLKKTTARQVYPDGAYVPRGDTPKAQTKFRPPVGDFASNRTGQWIYHRDETYMMVTSGHASTVHKHPDDAQLLLQYGGVDFFLDGGYYGFGAVDPRVKGLRTFAGHSVLTFDELSSMTTREAYVKNGGRVRASLDSGKAGSVPWVKAEVLVDGQHRLSRRIDVVNPCEIRLEDGWSSALHWTGNQRFLVPADSRVEISGRTLSLTRCVGR